MALSGKLIGAAIIGGGSAYLMQGDWSRRAKARAISSAAFGWAIGEIALHLFPELKSAPDEVKMGVVCICCGFVGYVFDRFQDLSIKATIGPIEIKSEKKDETP